MLMRCVFGERTQLLLCADLLESSTLVKLQEMIAMSGCGGCDLVYSDPPWNPGNEKYWRQHAEKSEPKQYDAFLNAWCDAVQICINRGAEDIFCEQSNNPKHREMLLEVVKQKNWRIPLLEDWVVFYGTPSSVSCSTPNRLLHFGKEKIDTNPSGMIG